MAVFAVYAPPGDLARSEIAERVVFVREGFRPVAFLLPWLYFLLNRAWLPLLLYVGGLVVVNLLAVVLGIVPILVVAVNLLYAVLMGLEAPGLRQWSLTRKGLDHVASVVARKAEEAEMRFFSSVATDASAGAPAMRPPAVAMPREHGHALLFSETGRLR